jgi:hypothetical protein
LTTGGKAWVLQSAGTGRGNRFRRFGSIQKKLLASLLRSELPRLSFSPRQDFLRSAFSAFRISRPSPGQRPPHSDSSKPVDEFASNRINWEEGRGLAEDIQYNHDNGRSRSPSQIDKLDPLPSQTMAYRNFAHRDFDYRNFEHRVFPRRCQ